MNLPVEDEASDILSKAQKGQGISTETLAARSGVDETAIRSARRGEYEGEVVAALARELGLKVDAVSRIAAGDWRPNPVGPIDGFGLYTSPFHDWQVNAYLVWDAELGKAVAFDTGTDAAPLVDALENNGLELAAVILTHAHRDHVEGLKTLLTRWPSATVFLGGKESSISVETKRMDEGFRYELGRLRIEGFDTPGHTEGGMSFAVEGLACPVAVVGDALFAGSMGGANVSYEAGLRSVERLLSLPKETVLAPGHGPLTTVAEERRMNCFAPAD